LASPVQRIRELAAHNGRRQGLSFGAGYAEPTDEKTESILEAVNWDEGEQRRGV
jgi:hypothetical protein